MAIDLTLRATDAADMPAIRAVLDAHQVQADGLYLHAPGIDGVFESSYLGSASFYGQLFGITPSPAACSLLFDLAVAGPLIITCEPGPPQIVLCGAGIEPAEVVDESIPP
ncbi:hypothetical protein C3B44_03395 [Corynebacterium yudongzhengii]|uniref:Uncharacterized protein n=1 Tax=Corynebacterium yudongzhengii TaxID=2080740 RepID=A0A2U1T7F7_9CORY|nr:hypothetical protein [Corynebacterium yudongzhengii]AWB81516.1 hypothetical protein C3B44_03395 [Corynebacterium yudongzhengii]PWC01913.1 hypothetical protein DF222_04850 [Corynebacterium yudongzhengii]